MSHKALNGYVHMSNFLAAVAAELLIESHIFLVSWLLPVTIPQDFPIMLHPLTVLVFLALIASLLTNIPVAAHRVLKGQVSHYSLAT